MLTPLNVITIVIIYICVDFVKNSEAYQQVISLHLSLVYMHVNTNAGKMNHAY